MSTPLSKHQFVKKLLELQKANAPVLFFLVIRSFPGPVANGHGVVETVDGDSVTIAGRAGSLQLILENGAEYLISGHFAYSNVQKAGLPDDLYFQRLKRVRALLVIAREWEANLVFGCGVIQAPHRRGVHSPPR